jgi:ATP-dependent HslUV protease ATP-binding subunit HslU
LENVSFQAQDLHEKDVTINARYVKDQLQNIVKDQDLSRFIL